MTTTGSDPIATRWRTPARQQLSPFAVALSLVPSLVYLGVHAVAGRSSAMVAASVAGAAVAVTARRRGRRSGLLLPASLVYLLLRTSLGLATDSDLVYFGGGLVLSTLVAVTVGATAFTRVPLAVHLIPLVSHYRHLRPTHPRYRRVAAQVTAAWAIAELATVLLELRHLLHEGGAAYVQSRTAIALPVMAGLVWLLVLYVRARLDPVEFHLAHQHGRTSDDSTDR